MASVKKYNDGLTKTQRHRLRHPERAAQTARKYRLNHPDKSRASILKWRKENPEQWREICQRSQFKRAFGDGEGARKHYAEQRPAYDSHHEDGRRSSAMAGIREV